MLVQILRDYETVCTLDTVDPAYEGLDSDAIEVDGNRVARWKRVITQFRKVQEEMDMYYMQEDSSCD